MSNDVKLEPCPFCGSDTAQTRTIRWNPVVDRLTVSCAHGCHADGPPHEIEAEAIVAWNQRHQPQREDVAGLAEEVGRIPVRTEIVNVDTSETGAQSVVLSLDLRDRILTALSAKPEAGESARYQPQREAVLEEANIERVARAMDPPLWADHVETAHMAASPLQVCYARERSLERARLFLTEYAALTTPAPAVSRDETNLADELERLLNKRADRSVPGGRVHDELTHFVEKHRVAILSRLRGEGE